ncbi:FecR domain-containing protein [Pontibacter sp. 172403-2]|uniref:FecR family protein n=1 Tax=Pontibacter rufus TaxID=2791028 RepID=UPI0018AF76DC|nr:FecR domain-containing protein [Pontibacter sp. 172403-2]MBF9254483.1 FecR domain-containing protein [Pontibacter sp. 172403-2]
MDYSEYDVADFAADDFFIQWVKNPTAAGNQFWIKWLADNPAKQEAIQEARKLVVILSGDEDKIQDWELDEIWQKLSEARAPYTPAETTGAKVIPLRFWQKRATLVAAALGLLLLVAGFILSKLVHNPPVEYATRYGERRTIQLPDSSVVVLNANSSLTVPAEWTSGKPREVHLKGEAYFSVSHKLNNQKFIVYTSDGIQVEVLGTAFNVSDRGNKSEVVLASGKVRLNIARTGENKQVIMLPGELVEVPDKAGTITKREVNTALYTSWKDNKLVFDNTSLREIATMLEDDYGYTVVFRDTTLADKEITAYLDAGSLDDILVTLSETLDMKITRENKKTIMISNY